MFHHSLTIFYSWPPSDLIQFGLPRIVGYLAGLSKIYGLGLFTFISGFLLVGDKYKKLTFSLLFRKAKRILMPCLIAGVLYWYCFPEYIGLGRGPINGTHLWYLPMIFIFYLLSPILNSDRLLKSLVFLSFFIMLNTILYMQTKCVTYMYCVLYLPYLLTGVLVRRGLCDVKGSDLKLILFIAFVTICFYNDGAMSYVGAAIEIVCLYLGMKYVRSLWNNSYLAQFPKTVIRTIKKIVRVISDNSFLIYIAHPFIIILLIKYVNRDVAFFKTYMFTLCFMLSIILPLLITYFWHKVKVKFHGL